MFLPFLLPERTSEVVFWLFLLRQKKKKKKQTIKFTILGVQVGGVHYIRMVVQQISGTFHLATVKVSPTDTNFPLHLPPALGNHLSAVCFCDFDRFACFP